ncbi:unnamed protein product [Parnassius apollo]|uniref:(apollo) hypothetical protein n=1 Tax=Parnassius apollo TaxID=110799 RepID=A0A8S3WFW3_PARAO|nr:unnamed protein product [Parnassius apollo]
MKDVLVCGKGAFQYSQSMLKIRVATQTTQAIIIATSVLHNICRLNNIRDVDPEVAMPQESGDITYAEGIGQQNHSVRQQLINNYFSV